MWRSLVLASLVNSAPLGDDRLGVIATPDGIDELAAEFTTAAPLSLALAARLDALRTTHDAILADETLRLYGPLAERAGLGALRHDLDDASFQVVNPALHARLDAGAADRTRLADTLGARTDRLLARMNITGAVSHRTKSAWSTWKKMQAKRLALDEVHDRIALRVIVDTEEEARRVLDALHARYRPVAGEFDDYIANPKPNGYRSLHTAVHVDGGTAEFQVRTWAMHHAAESGDAAHWRYKLVG